MKILHVPYCFSPDPVGGTEVYVESLAHELQRLGDSVLIAAPAARDAAYVHENIPVRRFAVDGQLRSLEALYGEGDAVAAASFEKLLDDERPEIVHLHALTSAISPRLASAVRRRRIPLVFTYHTPTVSCPRQNLLRWGKAPCTGELTPAHCTACTLHSLGLPRWAGALAAKTPGRLGALLEKKGRAGGLWTALRMRSLLTHRETAFQDFMGQADRIIAVSAWVRDVLLRNHIPSEKIMLCRHGLSETSVEKPLNAPRSDAADRPLRLVFVGRLEPVKGLDLLLRVLKKEPCLPVTLDAYGIAVQGNEKYLQTLYTAASLDSRVRLLPSIPHADLLRTLAAYDLLVVPSQGLETGPLVVLEGFAAGVPTLGSRLGGILEWIDDERSGRLVEATSLPAWGDALKDLAQNRSALARWRKNLPRPRSMREVAGEMRELYGTLLGSAHA